MRLSGKRIVLGVTGSIAAYKSASLCRLLVGEGADVQVIMTESATGFITPLTLSVLSKNPVQLHMISEDQTWNNHVELGIWADLLLVAPASANTMAAFASGSCDNLLQAVYLSARCPVMIAPAMDHDMFLHPSTTENLNLLKTRKHLMAGPASGALASGLTGEGRMLEPEEILEQVVEFFLANKPLRGKKVLVNAGPTQEPIDPVRYITNHSSGKMGVAIAEAFYHLGAEVTLVAGPLQIPVPHFLKHVPVVTAADMLEACSEYFPSADVTILSAAVADYKPVSKADQKIKKKEEVWQLQLEKTKDVLLHLGSMKKPGQLLVGFALETENEVENARVKLEKKNLDLIVLNSLNDPGAGFAVDTNKVSLIFKDNTIKDIPLLPKSEVAREIVQSLVHLMHV